MRVELLLSVAARFLRSRSLALSTVVVFVTAAVLVGMFVVLKAFTLSGAQVADRDLGRFANQLDLSAVSSLRPGDTGAAEAVAAAARRAGAQEVVVSLTSFDVRPDLVHPPLVLYLESDWATSPFPNRFRLTKGRWPARPGEVVLTRPLADATNDVGMLSVLSGNERLRVVGMATDRFDSFLRMLAAPGTWRAFGPQTRRNFTTVLATPSLMWNGAPEPVVAAIREALAASARSEETGGPSGEAGGRSGTAASRSPEELAGLVQRGLRTRGSELVQPRRSWVERIPLAYQVPSLALPLLSVLTVFGLNNRRFRRSIRVMVSVGVGRSVGASSVVLATAVWTMVAALAGALAGVGLGALGRLLCDGFLAGPVSPFPAVGGPVLRLSAVTAAACLLAGVFLFTGQRETGQRDEGRRATGHGTAGRSRLGPVWRHLGVVLTNARRLAGLAASLAVAAQAATLDGVAPAMVMAGVFGVAVLLFTPELVAAAIRLVPSGDPRTRLGRRQLSHDRDRATAGVAVLAAALGAPLGLLTLLATLISTAEAERTPDVAPHQVVLSSPAGAFHPPAPEVVRAVTARVAFEEPPVRTGYLWTNKVKVTVSDSGIGTVLVVDSVAEAERLNNGPLPADRAATLHDGGMLVWDGAGRGRRTLVVHDAETGQVLRTAGPLETGRVDFQSPWDLSTGGLVLASTAERLGLDVRRAALVFTGVSDEQATAARQATIEAGLDPYQVGVYRPPAPVKVPPVFYTAAAGLGLIVLVTTTAVARTQVSTLRAYVGRLIAVGLSTRWVRQVLLVQSATVVAASTLLAALIAVPPVLITVLRLPEFDLSIPWGWLGTVLAAFYCATAMATMVSSRRLRAADRIEEAR